MHKQAPRWHLEPVPLQTALFNYAPHWGAASCSSTPNSSSNSCCDCGQIVFKVTRHLWFNLLDFFHPHWSYCLNQVHHNNVKMQKTRFFFKGGGGCARIGCSHLNCSFGTGMKKKKKKTMLQGSAGEKGNRTSIRLLSSLLQRSGCPIIVLLLVTNLKRGITLNCLPAWLRPEGFVLH